MIIGGLVVAPTFVHADTLYSDGTYGDCTYNTCGISLTSTGTVNVNITPGSGTTCTVASDDVDVLTDSLTGYTLTVNDDDTDTNMDNGAGATIATSTASNASPAALTANKWGYRVDSIGGFGSGPTSAISSGGIPVLDFAGMPLSTDPGDTIATSPSPANPAVTTTVWYGLCVNLSKPSSTYTNSIVYTAVVN